MTDVLITDGQKLDQAAAALTATQDLIAAALSTLKSKTLVAGRVSPAKLDDYQLISYELSLCWSECTSAGFLLAHARRLVDSTPQEDTFPIRLANLFCAEAVNTTLARLRARPADYGLDDAEIAQVNSGDTAVFLAEQLAAGSIAAIGQEVLDRDGDLGADLLNEHHTMMRDNFRRFSDDVVAPLAEEVHREDLKPTAACRKTTKKTPWG
jgi:(2S)-methylsuccinyl-CoA dehydrogenase